MGAGRQVTDEQVKEVRRNLNRRTSLQHAAMKAGMDRKTARKYRDLGRLPSEVGAAHTWRTRADPLVDVWPRLEDLLQREPTLQAKTLVDWLQREYPGQDWQRQRRTVERRVRQWKGQHGPAKEVFFSQVHEAGRLGSSDFTHMEKLAITIQGQPFAHLLYHFVLTYSNWEYVSLCFSESFASLSAGMQDALWELGAVPERHRTDRMTLAVHHDGNLEMYTTRYQALMRHYGVLPEATNAYSGHENGDCEQGHRRFKEALEQELMLRGSRDFASRQEYEKFLRALVTRRNGDRVVRLAEEQARLHSLPERRLETSERQRARVSQGATIQVKKNTYSVPARLRGEWVEARIGVEEIEVWYAGERVQTMERLRGVSKHRIDYRHIIEWLVRKPGAFARYVYREDLYPSVTYRRCYDALVEQLAERADREYVRLLYLAAREGEARVEGVLAKLVEEGRPVSEQAVQTLLGSDTALSEAAGVSVPVVDLRLYDALLEGASAAMSESGRSESERNTEEKYEQGCAGGIEAMPARAASGDRAERARGSGTPGDGGIVELRDLSLRVAGTRMSATTTQPDRAVAEGIAAAAGEELVGTGPQTTAGEGGATVAGPVERGLSGPAGERAGVWPARLGEDTHAVRRGPGTGACRTVGAVDEVRPTGPGTAEGQTRLATEGTGTGAVAVGGLADRRPGLRAAEPRGDGGLVHAAGGALRTRERAGNEQPGLFAVGADLQGPDDDRSGDRPAGASQRDRGDERAELPGGVGETAARNNTAEGGVTDVERRPRWGPGSAAVAVAALRLPPLRQAPTAAQLTTGARGILIVGNGEG